MMSFIFNYFVSMRYLLLGYLRRCVCIFSVIPSAAREPYNANGLCSQHDS